MSGARAGVEAAAMRLFGKAAAALDPIDVVARTAWGEGRGFGRDGMAGPACVILNRARNPRWWGGPDLVSVCLMPEQFSCWNAGDPNAAEAVAVDGADPEFMTALVLADEAVREVLADITDGADSYYAVNSTMPYWVEDAQFTKLIGGENYYRVELKR